MSEQRPVATTLSGESALIRAVGMVALTAAVLNITVGGGIFRSPSILYDAMGASAPVAFIAGALIIMPIALCFAAVGSRVASTGGPYTYCTAAFGAFPGFIAGALMWVINVSSSAGIMSALMDQLGAALPVLREFGPRAALVITIYATLIGLNAFGVKLGAGAITFLAALKLTPLFLLAGIGLFFIDFGQISLTMPTMAGLGTSMVLVIFAYAGMETALVPSGEVRDPSRDVPRATLAAVALVVLLYTAIQIVCQGALGAALSGAPAPVARAAGALWAPGFQVLITTASVSMLAFLLGNLLGSSRILYALGRDGWLPTALGRVTATHRVPLLAIVIHAGVACVLAVGGTFEKLALISGGANCVIYALVAIAAWVLQRRDVRDAGGTPFLMPGGPLMPLLATVTMIAVLATLTSVEWIAIGIATAALVAIYGVLQIVRRRRA
jgi:amino acid transporter